MASCEILDWRCIFVSEIFGNVLLTVIVATIGYFMIASKLRFGFDTTIALIIPILLIIGLAISSFNTIMAFATVATGLMLAWIFNKIIEK